jgi:hypothetical protein
MLDYEFLKEYSWSLTKLIQYIVMTVNVTETANLSQGILTEFQAVKNFSSEYVSELEARYNSCSHPNSATQPSTTRVPDEKALGGPLVRSLKWYDQYMTYRLVPEEMPEMLFLVDAVPSIGRPITA